MDYFLARYYSSAQGRFTSVDPGNAGSNVRDAQTWNGYAYSRNNPLKYIDPTGMVYRLYDLSGNSSDHSDQNVNDYRKQDGVVFKKGKIFDKDGNQLGTYRRLSDDSQSDLYNQTVFGLAARGSAMNQAIGGFAVGTVVIGATGGTAAYFGGVTFGGGLTTLGVAGGPSASSFIGITAEKIIVINQSLGGTTTLTGYADTVVANRYLQRAGPDHQNLRAAGNQRNRSGDTYELRRSR